MYEYCECHVKHINTPVAVYSFLILQQSEGRLCVYTAGILAVTTKLYSGETTHLIIFYFRW